jgi:hypothetical protein
MRPPRGITATCHACERDFEFVEIYEPATSWQTDPCPHCDARLGIATSDSWLLRPTRRSSA